MNIFEQFLNKISYKFDKGYPDIKNPNDIILIKKSIAEEPPKDNRIDSLSHIVDSLNIEYTKLKHNYDSAQANARVEIQKIYIQNAKDVSNIRSYTVDQRDSMWSTLNP